MRLCVDIVEREMSLCLRGSECVCVCGYEERREIKGKQGGIKLEIMVLTNLILGN